MFRRVLVTLPLAAILAAAGCSSATVAPTVGPSASSPRATGSTPPSAKPSPSPAAATLLLRITSEGGFVAPSANLAALPNASVYSDGRILAPAPQDAIFPGPLLPTLNVRNVGQKGITAILDAIRKGGLDKPGGGGGGIPGDTGTTIFTVVVDGQRVTTRFPGLTGGPPGPGGHGTPGASDDPARVAAKQLVSRLGDPTDAWGGTAGPASVYQPSGFRLYVAPGGPQPDASASQAPVTWPLTTPLSAFGTPAVPDRGIAGLRQGVLLGAEAAALAPILRSATAITPFVSGGKSYTLYVRPLLPDEVPG
jgi:hypothetical protein